MLRYVFWLFYFCPLLAAAAPCPELLQISQQKLRSNESIDFCQNYRGKVILAVNTASRCGFTPQFKGLEALYQKYKDRGLVILGFPSGDFFQEFDDAEETAKVCYVNYGVTFPMFAKSSVRGNNANAFFKKLAEISGTTPKWNFYKYLIAADGQTVEAFSNFTEPAELDTEIETLLLQTYRRP